MNSEKIKEFKRKGYTIIENALLKQELSLLHQEADILINYSMSEGYDIIEDLGCIIEPWSCGYLELKDNNYKSNKEAYRKNRTISLDSMTHLSSDLILNKYSFWAKQLLQSRDLYLLNEQFIVKPPKNYGSSEFEWHRDSDYYSEKEYRDILSIACWTALDDINEENGTLEIIDFEDNRFNLKLKAGGVLFISHRLLHKSRPNTSRTFRRAFMVQFSVQPIGSIGFSIPV